MKAKKTRNFIEKVGCTLLGVVIPHKQNGVTRKEAAALAYGASMGVGVGYGIATGELLDGSLPDDPQEFAVIFMSKLLADWPEERERYLKLGTSEDDSINGVYVTTAKR